MITTVGSGAPQQQHLRALNVSVLTGKVQGCVSHLQPEERLWKMVAERTPTDTEPLKLNKPR